MYSNITRLFDFPYYQLENYPQQNCFVYKEEKIWKSVSTKTYINTANKISRALLKLGIKPNDKIAVITTNNNHKWHMLDVGTLQIGAVNVPLYPTFSEKDYAYILNHSDAIYCFVSDDELYQRVNNVIEKTQLKKVFTFEEIDTDYSWSSFLELGNSLETQPKVEEIKKTIKAETLATVLY